MLARERLRLLRIVLARLVMALALSVKPTKRMRVTLHSRIFHSLEQMMKKNSHSLRTTLAIAISSLVLTACGTSAIIKDVPDKQVDDLKASATSKPIQFTKVVVKLKRGEHVGALQGGLACVPQGDLTWRGGRMALDSDSFTEAFKEELEAHSFKTVGDTSALFEDPSTWKSEILVAGLIKELKANICYPMAGFGNFTSSQGEAFVKVDWQIYSKLDRSVVHTVATEGAFKNKSGSTASGGETAVLNAFSQATRHLLADVKFREIVSRGGETVKGTTNLSGGNIVVSTSTSKSVSSDPKDWSDAVVTVFAGSGHGSGFVISDNLIMTNHHVIGESNSVTVKFNNGMQVVGKAIASNSGRDVALVRIEGSLPKHFKVAKSLPTVGSDVFAVGTPRAEKFHSTVSRGIVSGIREDANKTLIQSDVNVMPGNSGGPLLNKEGQVVGICVSGVSINNAPVGLNFFIPIDDALKTLGVIL